MTEESALDVIFEMREMLRTQQQEIKMLQASLNTIGGKVNKTIYPDFVAPKGMPAGPPKKDLSHLYQPDEKLPEALKPKAEPAPAPAPPMPKQKKNIRVFGHFDDDTSKPLSGVVVRITDANNNVVKQTKSNRAGLWNSFLPPGDYIAEFVMQGMQSEARQFQLLDGQGEVEVN